MLNVSTAWAGSAQQADASAANATNADTLACFVFILLETESNFTFATKNYH
jgi:hypothetical protein